MFRCPFSSLASYKGPNLYGRIHRVSPCLTVSHNVSPCLTMSHHVSPSYKTILLDSSEETAVLVLQPAMSLLKTSKDLQLVAEIKKATGTAPGLRAATVLQCQVEEPKFGTFHIFPCVNSCNIRMTATTATGWGLEIPCA